MFEDIVIRRKATGEYSFFQLVADKPIEPEDLIELPGDQMKALVASIIGAYLRLRDVAAQA